MRILWIVTRSSLKSAVGSTAWLGDQSRSFEGVRQPAVAAILLEAAARGAQLNVAINLKSIKDEELAEKTRAEVASALAAKGVNLRGLSVSDTVDHAVVRMVVSDPDGATDVLEERGALVIETEILAIPMPDKPWALAEAAEKLSKAGVNIEYAYGSAHGEGATLYLRVSSLSDAQKALR